MEGLAEGATEGRDVGVTEGVGLGEAEGLGVGDGLAATFTRSKADLASASLASATLILFCKYALSELSRGKE